MTGASRVVFAALVLAACAKPPERDRMAYVPAGEFLMGIPSGERTSIQYESAAQPQHPVYVDAFFMDRWEVTNAEFERFEPSYRRAAGWSDCDECPATQVSWFQAQAYCAAQSPPKRLPTEAEWERAAKGGSDRAQPEPLGEYAWYIENSPKRTQPVGQKKPNGYGIYDMLGNAREWVADWWSTTYYAERVRENPKGPATGTRRAQRGGGFFQPQRGVTATIRYHHEPQFRLYFLGFRCAADVPR